MSFARFGGLTAAGLLAGTVGAHAHQTTLTITAVNTGDLIVIKTLSPKVEQATGIELTRVALEETVLRPRVPTVIATRSHLPTS